MSYTSPSPEKVCPRCKESWPLTLAFYRRIKASGRERWQSWCRACEAEWLADKRASMSVAVEVNNVKATWREHLVRLMQANGLEIPPDL